VSHAIARIVQQRQLFFLRRALGDQGGTKRCDLGCAIAPFSSARAERRDIAMRFPGARRSPGTPALRGERSYRSLNPTALSHFRASSPVCSAVGVAAPRGRRDAVPQESLPIQADAALHPHSLSVDLGVRSGIHTPGAGGQQCVHTSRT